MDWGAKAVLVTGASRGLGAALASELARRGARVVAVAREPGPLEEQLTQIRAAGGEAHALVADQGEREAVYPLVGAATALVGPIDVLVLNASTLGPVPLRELPALDAALPLPELSLVPPETVAAVEGARRCRGRVVAVGTTVVRALEGAWRDGALRAGAATTALRVGPGFEPRVVSGLLTGLHEPGESHFELLQAFAPRAGARSSS